MIIRTIICFLMSGIVGAYASDYPQTENSSNGKIEESLIGNSFPILTKLNKDPEPMMVQTIPPDNLTVFKKVNDKMSDKTRNFQDIVEEKKVEPDALAQSSIEEKTETPQPIEPKQSHYSLDTRIIPPPAIIPSLDVLNSGPNIIIPDFNKIYGLWTIKGFKTETGYQCMMETHASNGSQFVYMSDANKGGMSTTGFLLSSHAPEGTNAILKLNFDNLLSITFRAVARSGALEMMLDENKEVAASSMNAFRIASILSITETSTGNQLKINLKGSLGASKILSECMGQQK